jgi:hypothetical protein
MSKEAISEAASEKKRGRPRVITEKDATIIEYVSPDVKTERGRQNVYYRLRATNALLGDSAFSWLCDRESMHAGEGKWRKGLLSELGRIPNLDDLKTVAAEICKIKPKAKEGIRLIRRLRIGRTPEPNYLDLITKIATAVDDYFHAHPSTPADWFVRALRDLAELEEASSESC